MTCTTLNTPVRDGSRFVKIVATALRRVRLAPTHRLRISDHIARDIGLPSAELERLNHVWPSQSQRHPML